MKIVLLMMVLVLASLGHHKSTYVCMRARGPGKLRFCMTFSAYKDYISEFETFVCFGNRPTSPERSTPMKYAVTCLQDD